MIHKTALHLQCTIQLSHHHTMIEIKNLTFGYNRYKTVFHNLNMSFATGGIYGLLGKNGSGKSTLLHLISGLLTPLEGEIDLNCINVRDRLPSTLSETFIVPEEFDLPKITMEEYCRINAPFYPNFSIEDLKNNLATFNLNSRDNLGMMSMGQKKKAFMCFALACNTQLLLMDEPTNGLDLTSKVEFRRFIASHMNQDRIIIISTHQVHDIELLLDHLILIGDGNPIINCPIDRLTERLRFFTGATDDKPLNTLFTSPTLGGYFHIALRQPDEEETELNLESLFEMAMQCPEMLSDIFPLNEPTPISNTKENA